MLRSASGAACIAAGYAVLFAGSAPFGVSAASLLPWSRLHPSWPMLGAGLLLGAIGAGLLSLGLRWCREESPRPVTLAELLGFGLLSPGSAQAYAGRWMLAAFLLYFPFAVGVACIALALVVRQVAHLDPAISAPATRWLAWAAGAARPSVPLYALLWLISLADGASWWRGRRSSAGDAALPRRKGSLIALGFAIYTSVLLLMLLAQLLGACAKLCRP